MKKIITLLSLALMLTAQAFCYKIEYNVDFDQKINVPDTKSQIVTKPQKMDTSMTALEFSKKLGNGINLGNTLEATRAQNSSTTRPATSYETQWGQPVTSPIIMEAYKAAGFSTIRIPVAWTNMMAYEKGDYKIETAYLDRVEEVVNYALDAGLYVIVNDHWDSQWWGMFGSADKNLRVEAVKLYKSMWTQIAVRFKNYDERLIFEGGNEELGSRLNDDTVFSKKIRGTLSEDQCYAAVNKINQTFVDLVRKTGGNNKNRFLLIPGYDTDIGKTCSNLFVMPTDTAENKLFISVHYYTPSTYCILSENASWGAVKNSWGTKPDYKLMNDNFAKMKKFTDQGYGVIIGEYGVAKTKDGEMKKGMCEWITNILDNSDKYNYVPMLWDCNTFFKKTGKLGFYDEALANVYKNRE